MSKFRRWKGKPTGIKRKSARAEESGGGKWRVESSGLMEMEKEKRRQVE